MFLFDEKFKIDLYSKAATSPRRRDHFNIHNDYQDPVQRIAIALLHGTYIPPHKHTQSHQWEFFHVVEGEVKLILFSEQGTVTEIYLLGDKHKVFAVQLPPNIFHTLVCISSKAFIFEWKQGPFVLDTAKEIPHWSMPENDINISSKVQHLEKVIIGDNFTDNI
ncbi:WbuC family cupin fold metalloprotein [Yersinia rochesterensis]|uniref:WbuC family cupin fold metalloprotein n=1 Tax=Yersinia rochesterensis TaxID=1604335 RepID=UPI00285335C6|nr:WbuC family cupin fold metalloprotein [Yersinia rochesterensis]MDR5019460.1 WbuC family cupin fold metalloprotein [Yersinia rochesterensis]